MILSMDYDDHSTCLRTLVVKLIRVDRKDLRKLSVWHFFKVLKRYRSTIVAGQYILLFVSEEFATFFQSFLLTVDIQNKIC